MNFDIEKRTILKVLHGSHAYGMSTPESDKDYKGVAIPTLEYYFGFLNKFEQAEKYESKGHDYDEVIYDLSKFCKLAGDCNPNVIEVLHVSDKEVIKTTSAGEKLRENADLFISAKAKFTFTGYAHSQLKRINTHRRWLLNPPKEKPTRKAYGLPEDHKLLSKSELGAITAMVKKDETVSLSTNVLESFHRERAYGNALKEWNQYLHWKETRNKKRAELEQKYGFDCYSEDTEFLTDSGWKYFDEISINDKLATVLMPENCPKHKNPFILEYQNYIDKFDGLYTGNMYNLYGYHTDVLVTPNHRMLYRKKERKNEKLYNWKLDEAFYLPDTFEILKGITPNKKNYCNGDIFKDLKINPSSIMRLMGWYLSEGSLVEEKKLFRISQVKPGIMMTSMKKFYRKYKDVINCSWYSYEKKPNEWNPKIHTENILEIRDKRIFELISQCGKTKNKRIPRWVFGLSKRLMDFLFDGLLQGDGSSRPDNGNIYYSSQKTLADDVQELAVMCGYETSLYGPYLNEKKWNNKIKKCEMYQVYINRTRAQFKKCIRSKNIKKEFVKNKRIVCFTVPNRTLITRRNGHVGIHGNSKHGAHLVRLLRMGVEILEGKGIIVKRPDAEELLAIRRGFWSYDDLIEHAEYLEQRCNQLYDDLKSQEPNQRVIPLKPNRNKIDQLCQELTLQFCSKDLRKQLRQLSPGPLGKLFSFLRFY